MICHTICLSTVLFSCTNLFLRHTKWITFIDQFNTLCLFKFICFMPLYSEGSNTHIVAAYGPLQLKSIILGAFAQFNFS